MDIPPLADLEEVRRTFGFDDEGRFMQVMEDGNTRLRSGQTPVMPYKDLTDPLEAYELASAEWAIRAFKTVRPGGAEHLMHDLKRVNKNHYQVFLTPWADGGYAAINQLRDFARWASVALKQDILVEADMNGVTVRINRRSRVEYIRRDWLRAVDGCITDPIGPSAKARLSDAELRNDHRIITEQAVTRALKETEAKARYAQRQKELETALADAPEMAIGNTYMEARWREIPANELVVNFGARWARLMQAEMAAGKTLEETLNPTYWLAHGNLPALFGSEVGAVISYLAQAWSHGEHLWELRHLI